MSVVEMYDLVKNRVAWETRRNVYIDMTVINMKIRGNTSFQIFSPYLDAHTVVYPIFYQCDILLLGNIEQNYPAVVLLRSLSETEENSTRKHGRPYFSFTCGKFNFLLFNSWFSSSLFCYFLFFTKMLAFHKL